MRSMLLIAALALVPAPAFAGAISTVTGPAGSADITFIRCAACAPAAVKPAGPELPPGHELIKVEEVAGKPKIFRTENWLGGSPVTYVTTADETELARLKRAGVVIAGKPQMIAPGSLPVTERIAARDGLDRRETAALPRRTASPSFDAAALKLRLTPALAAQ